MMRIAYISGVEEAPLPKAKKPSAKDAFLEEVRQTLEVRHRLDEQRANELFAPELEELEKLKTTLNKLKQQRDEILY